MRGKSEFYLSVIIIISTAGGGLAALSGPPLAGRMSDITKVEILRILQQIMIVIFRATLESL